MLFYSGPGLVSDRYSQRAAWFEPSCFHFKQRRLLFSRHMDDRKQTNDPVEKTSLKRYFSHVGTEKFGGRNQMASTLDLYRGKIDSHHLEIFREDLAHHDLAPTVNLRIQTSIRFKVICNFHKMQEIRQRCNSTRQWIVLEFCRPRIYCAEQAFRKINSVPSKMIGRIISQISYRIRSSRRVTSQRKIGNRSVEAKPRIVPGSQGQVEILSKSSRSRIKASMASFVSLIPW